MATYQIAFYKGRKKFFNRAVSWWLRGPYSHCELVLEVVGATSTCLSSSISDGGVRLKYMELDPEHWDLVSIDISTNINVWISKHIGNKYDWLGLLGFVWRREYGDNRKWFCSEAVADILGYKEPWRFDPMTLWCTLVNKEDMR